MKRSDIKVVPAYYQKYIDLAPDIELIDALKTGGISLFQENISKLIDLGLQTYAPDKWTVNQMVEHIMDTERIFVNRALRFARNDQTELPGYDENMYASNARSNEFPIIQLMEQFAMVRKSTIATFENFNSEELQRTGKANGQEISVLALGFIQVGHPIHHFNVLKERYFPLITP